jgi:hypothetical protein
MILLRQTTKMQLTGEKLLFEGGFLQEMMATHHD